MKTDKHSIVNSVREKHRTYNGTKGDSMYVHWLEFENGDFGEFHSTNATCIEFAEGMDASYSIEQKGFFKGEPDFRIKPLDSYNGPARSNAHGGTKQTHSNSNTVKNNSFAKRDKGGSLSRNETAIMAQHAITKSIELICYDKIGLNELFSKADEVLRWTIKRGKMSFEEILTSPTVLPGPVIPSEKKEKSITKKNKGKSSDKNEKLF